MKRNRLPYHLYVWGILSLLIFVVTKNEFLMTKFATYGDPYGNLYTLSRVKYFKMEMQQNKPRAESFNSVDIDSCDIILIGDSHMRVCPGHDYVSIELSKRLERPVYYLRTSRESFTYFNVSGADFVEKRRICLLECGELRLHDRYYQMPDLRKKKHTRMMEAAERVDEVEPPLLTKIENRWFTRTELNYAYFLKNNIFTESVIEAWYTAQFDIFGRISPLTPVYSLDPPFIFNVQQTTNRLPTGYFFYHSDDFIAQLAANITAISDSLSNMYNMELVFMPIPNAFTIHHDLVTDHEYDEYLPRLCDALEARGVPTIRLYEVMKNPTEFIYHPSDTHLNYKGVSIMLDEMVRRLEELLPLVGESVAPQYHN